MVEGYSGCRLWIPTDWDSLKLKATNETKCRNIVRCQRTSSRISQTKMHLIIELVMQRIILLIFSKTGRKAESFAAIVRILLFVQGKKVAYMSITGFFCSLKAQGNVDDLIIQKKQGAPSAKRKDQKRNIG